MFPPTLLPVLCGLSLHLTFNKFDEFVHFQRLLWLLALSPSIPFLLLRPGSWSGGPFWLPLLEMYATSYLTLSVSVLAYRLSPLHPLARHPGPILARCTKLWGVYHMSTGKIHLKYLELHRRHGTIVRIGPNELSICDVDAIQPMFGTNGMAKGPLWDGRRPSTKPVRSIVSIRDTGEHLRRRRAWNQAFNTTNVKQYEPILRGRLEQLHERLRAESRAGLPIDLAELVSFFAYDLMGDLAFGGGFNLVRDGDVSGLWHVMEAGIRPLALMQHIPWVVPLLSLFPRRNEALKKYVDFGITMCNRRIKSGSMLVERDLSYHLLDEGSRQPQYPASDDYWSDAALVIVAGSDTTASVMSSILFCILRDKQYFDRLRDEVDEYFPRTRDKRPQDDISLLARLPLLNAIINETLRLYPPGPSSLQRAPEAGSKGKMVGSTFVPEGTGVTMPLWVLHRDPRYFSPDPERFWPERWLGTEDSDVVTNEAACIPFSIGPMNCVGKTLAQMEMRSVIATVVQTFDLELREGWNVEEWEKGLEDYLVLVKGKLPVVVRVREEIQ